MTDQDTTSALEQFRQQWREEVNARAHKKPEKRSSGPSQPKARRPSENRPERPINVPPTRHPVADVKQDDSDHLSDAEPTSGNSSTAMQQQVEGLKIGDMDDDGFTPGTKKEPQSALEHFERAVEKESQGSLGDSLAHYRKAYRLDAKVDQTYKNKHFAAAWKSKPTNTNPSNAPVTVPSTAHHSLEEPNSEPLTFHQLIDSFADSQIEGAAPIIPGDLPPPCGIKKLPTEVLLDLLQHVATRDPAIYVRLSLVCKKLAYHVITDNSIWKRVALGPEFGLASQQYNFNTDLQGREIIFQELEEDLEDEQTRASKLVNELSFPADTVWRDIFHEYPRIRFTGVYISTVNYTRPGGASATANTWSNPIHIVTYYRYLRFFRDGTCISLLTTNEPIEVVHHLTPENLNYVRTGKKEGAGHPLNFTSAAPALLRESHPQSSTTGTSGNAPPPSARDVMKHALRGRWRLCDPSLDGPLAESANTAPSGGAEPAQQSSPKPTMSHGDLHIETEGAGPRYMYTMHLSLKNAGSARSRHTTKNNKLVWKGFWSFNVLTNDWAEFHLRNDKPFFFSRVRGYGLGY
jgi:F-box protein 9